MFEVFSDGACKGNPGKGGWGAVVRSQAGEQLLKGYESATTNNRMELMGAIEGLRATPVGAGVAVSTDSQYVKKGMTEWIAGWKRRNWIASTGKPVLNVDLWKALDFECQQRSVAWKWVRGHSGHRENEMADALANQAIRDGK